MQTWLWTILFCAWMHVTVGSQSLMSDDPSLLQDLLRQSQEHNRKMEKQMNRIKLMWSGFQQMCSALKDNSCDCEKTDQPTLPEVGKSNVNATLLRVASGGLEEDGSVELTIVYRAGEKHLFNLMVYYLSEKLNHRDEYRPVDERVKQGEDVYAAKVRIPSISECDMIHLRLLSGNRGVDMFVDHMVALNVTEQTFTEYNSSVIELNYTQTAPVEGNLTIPLVIDENARNSFILRYSYLDLLGLNTLKSPPEVFELSLHGDFPCELEGEMKTESTSWMNITVPHQFAAFGGTMTIVLPFKTFKDKVSFRGRNMDLIERLFELHVVEIILPNSKKVVPDNTVGLFPLPKEIQIFQEKSTLSCMAMGNPPPVVTLYMQRKRGKNKKLRVQTLSLSPYDEMVSYTLDKNELKSPTPKRFICRATSGSNVVEQTVLVKPLIYTPLQFDLSKTGVMKNTTEKLVLGCKASWKTNPNLVFRLYHVEGPVLDEREGEGYKVVTKHIGTKATKITLTISPPSQPIQDTDTVVCVAEIEGAEQIPKEDTFVIL